jgi:hypothetical protein
MFQIFYTNIQIKIKLEHASMFIKACGLKLYQIVQFTKIKVS